MAFLFLECLAIVGFALGGNNIIFMAVGIIVGIFSILIAYNRFSKNEALSLTIFASVMFVLSLLVSFGNLFREAQGALNIFVLLSINLFLFMGIAARRVKQFKPETLLLTVGFSLALLVLVSMLYSWAQYGFFYALRYKGQNYVYYGEMYDVSKEGFWLIGFNFKETSLAYTGLYASLLTCYLFGLLFISLKENKRTFFMFLAIGLLGLIYLITIPYFKAFIFLIPTALFVLFYKYLYKYKTARKVLFYTLITFASLAIIFFLILLICASGTTGLTDVINNNAFLSRIFIKNRIMSNIYLVLEYLTKNNLFFGIAPGIGRDRIINANTGMFEIELAKEGGFLAIVFIVIFIVLLAFIIAKYIRTTKDNDLSKIIFVSLIILFFLYTSFNYDAFPITHESDLVVGDIWYLDQYNSFFKNPLTLLMLSLIGYIYVPLFIKDDEEYSRMPAVINSEEKEVKDVDNDYSFEESNDDEK